MTVINQFGSVSSTGRVSVLGWPSSVSAWGDNSGGQTNVPANLNDVVAVAGVKLGAETYAAKDHAPVFICASPFEKARDRYIVINSGHTFHEKEFAAFNYLLFPRLGDWAVMRITPGGETWKPGTTAFPRGTSSGGLLQ